MGLTVDLHVVKETSLAGVRNQTVDRPARSLVTVVTELSRLPQSN